MKTVPTLCASSTIVGISVTGYALGRLESPSTAPSSTPLPPSFSSAKDNLPTDNSNNSTNRDENNDNSLLPNNRYYSETPMQIDNTPPTSSYLNGLDSNSTSSSPRLRHRFSTVPVTPGTPDLSSSIDRTSRSPSSQQGSSSLSDIDKRATSGSTAVHSEGPVTGLPLLARNRSSWVKRLSSFSSSHRSTLTSSPRPESPAVSYSNGSATLSPSGSTVPIFGGLAPLASPPGPNKLVKRSSSHRVLSGGSFTPLTLPKRPTLRRPATSHQRSADLWQRSTPPTGDPDEQQHHHSAHDGCCPECPQKSRQQWPQYFSIRVASETDEGYNRRRHSAIDSRLLRRIYPDKRFLPVLLMGKAVSAARVEIENDSLSGDADSVFAASGPQTPAAATHSIFRPLSSGNPLKFDSSLSTPARRSFSFGDLLTVGNLQKRPHLSTAEVCKEKLRRKRPHPRRHFSAPIPGSLGQRQQPPPQQPQKLSDLPPPDELERPAKRRGTIDRPILENAHNHQQFDSRPQSYTFTVDSAQEVDRVGPSSKNSTKAQTAFFTTQSSYRISSTSEAPIGGTSPLTSETVNLSSITDTSHTYTPFVFGTQSWRKSTTPSEHASTLIGSDADGYKSAAGEDSEADLLGDTSLDSLRIRAPRGSFSASKGHTQPDSHDPVPMPSGGATVTSTVRECAPGGCGKELLLGVSSHVSILEEAEEEEYATGTDPSLTARPGSQAVQRISGLTLSSPGRLSTSSATKPRGLEFMGSDTHADTDESVWSFVDGDDGDDKKSDGVAGLDKNRRGEENELKIKLSDDFVGVLQCSSSPIATPVPSHPSSFRSPPLSNGVDVAEKEVRNNLFDWSEQQPAERSPGRCTPPRPKTVHGKKDADGRGCRSTGRRASSYLHARSQSVPVLPTLAGKQIPVVTNKFGTWGVGSKGIPEDWSDDFDFIKPKNDRSISIAAPIVTTNDNTTCNADGLGAVADDDWSDENVVIHVPENIRERQNKVLANIGLLKEWGLLIEELKELRARAGLLGLVEVSNAQVWSEVDAMIDLADHEEEDGPAQQESSPNTSVSSPGIDLAAFEDPPTSVVAKNSQSRRRSVLPSEEDDVFEDHGSKSTEHQRPSFGNCTSSTGRPRKDSEAVAKSVIEALQSKRSSPVKGRYAPYPSQTPSNTQPQPQLQATALAPSKKVPFDTATLKHIVPYVNGLSRKVKDALREAEGLYTSPTHRGSRRHHLGHQQPRQIQHRPTSCVSQHSSLTDIFRNPLEDSPTAQRRRTQGNARSNTYMPDETYESKEKELTAQLKAMAVN